MTHEELLKLCKSCDTEVDIAGITAARLAQGYLALSANLEEQQLERVRAYGLAQRLKEERDQLKVNLEEMQAERDNARALVEGILAAYREDDSLEACNACEDCGKVFMCSFHSVLSLLSGRTKVDAGPPGEG